MPPALRRITLHKALPYILILGGIIGIACSLVLLNDQIRIWENPNYIPSCNFNPIISCGSVISSKQGHIFGLPAPILGLLVFPALVTTGGAILAGARLKRWFWRALELGMIGGVGFALWLFWLSLFRIHALCPFCLGVDAVTYTLFWYITLYNIEANNISLPKGRPQKFYNWVRRHHLDILISWFLLIAAMILKHFWYYYGKHL